MFICTRCQKKYEVQTKFCAECGGKIEEETIPVFVCSGCGKEYAEEIKFCAECGGKVNGKNNEVTITETKFICSGCQKEYAEEIKFCAECGGKIEAREVVVNPAGAAPVQQAPVQQQAPIQQAPIQQAPIQQAPIQQAPIQQAPVQQQDGVQTDPNVKVKLPFFARLFQPRISRADFWILFLISLPFHLIVGIGSLVAAYFVISAACKRLCDTNKSPWLVALIFVPFAGAIICAVFCSLPGTEGPNRYGPVPQRIFGK